MYDVIVVGAGMAGLAAARRLSGRRVLLLEKRDYVGGRVRSVVLDEGWFEVGAMFPGQRLLSWLGEHVEREERQQGVKLVCQDGTLLSGKTRRELLNALQSRPDAGQALDALVAATHFVLGHCLDSSARRIAAVDVGMFSVKAKGGLSGLLDSIPVDCEISLESELTLFSAHDKGFNVSFLREGVAREVSCRALIVATEAQSTRALLRSSSLSVPAFIENITTSGVRVVVFRLPLLPVDLPNHAVFVGRPVLSMVFFRTENSVVVVAYMAASSFMPDEPELQAALQAMGWPMGGQAVEVVHRHDWPAAISFTNDEGLSRWRREVCEPLPGLFLAGDYLYPANPLGLEPAFITGMHAAEKARWHIDGQADAFLPEGDANTSLMQALRRNLAACLADDAEIMTALSPRHPPVAVGGVVGLAAGIAALRQAGLDEDRTLLAKAEAHLRASGSAGMWPYSRGGLPTATDSALVSFFVPACRWLDKADAYVTPSGVIPQRFSWEGDPENGVMRASMANLHWCGPDPFTTLLLAWVASRDAGQTLFVESVLLAQAERRGGMFVANPFLFDLVAVLALQDARSPEADALRRRIMTDMLGSRDENGLFGRYDKGLSTACAVLALVLINTPEERLSRSDMRMALQRAFACRGQTPFFSSLYIGKPGTRQSGAMFHELGGFLQVQARRFEITLYRDTAGFVTSALLLMAQVALNGPSQSELAEAPLFLMDGLSLGYQAETPLQYCACVLERLL